MIRKKNKKDVWLVLGLLIVLLLGYTFLPGIQQSNQPPYTIFSIEQKGISAFYETLKELGFPVEIGYQPVEKEQENSVHIIVEPGYRYLGDVFSIVEWVEQGGKAVFLLSEREVVESEMDEKEVQILELESGLREYKIGKGQLLIGDPDLVINQGLTKDIQGVYNMILYLEKWQPETIYINEYYHGYQQKKSLWRDTPKDIKRILYQVGIVIILWMFYKGKRLGKAEPFFEEVERTENEYLYAVADLYQQAGFYHIIFENYYEHFLIEAESFFGVTDDNMEKELQDQWRRKDLPYIRELKELQAFAVQNRNQQQKPRTKKEQREYLGYIQRIEKLLETIHTRSEQMWR